MTISDIIQEATTSDWAAQLRKNKHVISGDLRLDFADVALPKGLIVAYQEPIFTEHPQAAGYAFAIANQDPVPKDSCAPSLHGDVLFCTNPAQALDLLLQRADSFERALPDQLNRTEKVHKLGQFGLEWQWGDGQSRIITFVRHNAVVRLQGDGAPTQSLALATQLDGLLSPAATTTNYTIKTGGLLSPLKTGAVKLTERLDLFATPAREAGQLYFITTNGSVNRDIEHPDQWYYRAGLEPGTAPITLVRLQDWRPPTVENITVEVK